MPVTCAVFREAQWQITVALWPGREYLVVVRAIHGLQIIFATLVFHRREHGVLVVRQVAAL